MCVRECGFMCDCVSVNMCVRVHIHVSARVRVYMCMYVRVYVCTCSLSSEVVFYGDLVSSTQLGKYRIV